MNYEFVFVATPNRDTFGFTLTLDAILCDGIRVGGPHVIDAASFHPVMPSLARGVAVGYALSHGIAADAYSYRIAIATEAVS